MGEIIARPKSPAAMPFTGERLTSDYGGQTQIEHLHRYLLVREWCRGKDVLDVASGEGYGTALLAQVAVSAVGVELAPDAVDHAARSYPAPNLRYIAGDARDLPNPDDSFDVVVSFETIEHFAEQDQFLKEVRRVLRPGGLLVISTPDRDNYSPAEMPPNPFHVREMTGGEFTALLAAHFPEVSVLLQRPLYGSVLLPTTATGAVPMCFERRGEDYFEGSVGLSRPQYLIAFASDQPVTALPPSVYIDTGRLGLLSPPEAEARLQAAQDAIRASQAQEHNARAALSQAVAAAQDDQAQIEVYSVAARDRVIELEKLRDQVAAAQETQSQVGVQAAIIEDRETEIQGLRAELAGVRGEVRGLTTANEMAEAACIAMREEVSRIVRVASTAEASKAEADRRVRVLEAEVETLNGLAAAARDRAAADHGRAAAAEDRVRSLLTSFSWRLTAPVRATSRAVFRRP